MECVGLANEYMMGRLKQACTDYMISQAPGLQLNDALLFLRLAHKYQLPDVEKKVLSVHYKTSTADILKCSNFDATIAGPLLLMCAQWLETQVTAREKRISEIRSGVKDYKSWTSKMVSSILDSIGEAANAPLDVATCTNNHKIYSPRKYQKATGGQNLFEFVTDCYACMFLSITQVKRRLDEINRKNTTPTVNLTLSSFQEQLDKKCSKLNSL